MRNVDGQAVEEFEIQFIDGEALDCAFADAWAISHANIVQFMQAVDYTETEIAGERLIYRCQ